MNHTLIIAGGSGTRLWPMSRKRLPKQLIPFIGGRSLLQIAVDRLDGLVEPVNQYVCAGEQHRRAIFDALAGVGEDQFLGEPMGRDTLNAVGLAAAVIGRRDPDAVIGVFTADHIIEPVETFGQIVASGFALARAQPNALVTFGINPTHAATGYGYLQLGTTIDHSSNARVVAEFKEKPVPEVAQQYFREGSGCYLWNSGMFVWRAATLMACIHRYRPENYHGLQRIAQAWDTDQRQRVLSDVYPTLEKVSVDYAVMEPASTDPLVQVVAVPMPLSWLDVGSWPAFAQTCSTDRQSNALAAQKHITVDTQRTLLASSDPAHLIATIGCQDLLIVHTPDATLVCRSDCAQDIKKLHEMVGDQFGDAWL